MIPNEIKNMKPLTGKERFERDSEYMGAFDIDPGTEPVLTIKAIYRGKVTLSRGKELKNLIVFEEESVPGISTVRPLIINSTNRKTLLNLYKRVDAETLMGKKIRLYLEHNVRDPSTGERVDGIRIRNQIPTSAAPVEIKCEECGKVITAVGGFSAEQVAQVNRNRYNKALCAECGKKHKEMAQKAAESVSEALGDTMEGASLASLLEGNKEE